jgi:hypothetical protein
MSVDGLKSDDATGKPSMLLSSRVEAFGKGLLVCSAAFVGAAVVADGSFARC